MHHWSAYNRAIRKYESSSSFTSDIPLWIEVTNPNSFFDYFKDKFESNDVMVIWDVTKNHPILKKLKNFAINKNGDALKDIM